MDTSEEKANEVRFRLAIISKHQKRYDDAAAMFTELLDSALPVVAKGDVLLQIAHIHELKGEVRLGSIHAIGCVCLCY